MGERKTRWVSETARRAVNDLGYQRQRLKRARPESFQKQKIGKAPKVAFVGQGKHGAETPEIDVLLPQVMMPRQAEVPRFLQGFFRILSRDCQKRALRRLRLKI